MARVIKTIEEVLKLTGLDLGRYVKWLQKESKRFLEYERAGKLTPTRKKKLDEIGDQLSKIKGRTPPKSKSETKGVPKAEKGKDYTPEPGSALDKKLKELKAESAKTSGKKLTREQTAALNKRLAKKKEKIHEKVGSSGKGRTLDFTPEGEKLWETNTEASLDKLLKGINRYTYPGGRQALKPKTIEGTRTSEMPKSERIMKHMKGEDVTLTTDQIQDAMRARGAGTPPTKEELLELGGFEIFKKGGYKKFQGRSKLGSKEHIYAGGGSVSDISHFRKKKK